MIGYVTPGTNRFDDGAKFYDDLFDTIAAGRALEPGGSNEGAPGPGFDNSYADYYRGLDANKLNAVAMLWDESSE